MKGPVAVVVVTYNSVHVIDGLLDSVPDAMAGVPFQVVVVDNGSTDGTREAVSRRSGCRLIVSSNQGYSAGINKGIREAGQCDAILVLNPDVRLAPDSGRLMVEELARVPGAAVVVPRIVDSEGAVQPSLRREPTVLRSLGLNGTGRPIFSEYIARGTFYDHRQSVDWALGAVMALAPDVYEQLDGWDESFFLYSEETDYCLRARDAGFTTRYIPEAVAVHIGGQSGQSKQTHAMQIINRVRLYHRRNATWKSILYFAATIASETTWVVRGHSQSRFALRTLVFPRSRPPQLNCSVSLLP